ncbi:hypothetical protein [Haloferula sargassicola]|uniref:hypothetical protein n=1 Tax=Haloferula sargassicola TaxID=490096 RepID=UPI003365A536
MTFRIEGYLVDGLLEFVPETLIQGLRNASITQAYFTGITRRPRVKNELLRHPASAPADPAKLLTRNPLDGSGVKIPGPPNDFFIINEVDCFLQGIEKESGKLRPLQIRKIGGGIADLIHVRHGMQITLRTPG